MTKIGHLLFLAAIVGVWQFAADTWVRDPLTLPSPTAVVAALVAHRTSLFHNALITSGEAVGGFALGCGLAIGLASLGSFFPVVRTVTFPYAIAIKATPIIVLAPLVITWLGNDYRSKVVMAAVVCFFPVLVNASVGLQAVEKDWVNLMRLHHATKWDIFWILRVPNALPEVFAGLRIATSLAMVGALVAEFTGAQAGLGFLINTSLYYLNTDLVFAGVIATSLIGLTMYYLIVLLQRWLVFWQLEN